MSDLRSFHEEHGAEFEEYGGRDVVSRYRRPGRTHRAVRSGVGAIEMPYDALVVEGDDRVDYVDNVVSNRVPSADGEGCYALILDPHGGIEVELYAYSATERLLLFTPPGRAAALEAEWEVFVEDVDIRVASDEFAVFGVHGPNATEKIASVFSEGTPEEPLSFERGSIRDAGVTVVRGDGLVGEEGYEVVCAAADAADVIDSLLNHGLNAVPFGRETWRALTLEAGTPLFETELEGKIPNNAGVRNALDFEKGCYVGQEIVSRLENRGRPNERLVGLLPEKLPERGAAVFDGDAAVGEVTRAVESPMREEPIAMAYLKPDAGEELTVRADGEEVAARVETLPFVEGSDRSRRLPTYPET